MQWRETDEMKDNGPILCTRAYPLIFNLGRPLTTIVLFVLLLLLLLSFFSFGGGGGVGVQC